MSHIVQIKTQIRDAAAVEAACRRLGLKMPLRRTAKLFSGEASGLTVELLRLAIPGGDRRFSAAAGSPTTTSVVAGEAKRQFEAFIQSYAVEKARIEARKRGHSVTEQKLPDGSSSSRSNWLEVPHEAEPSRSSSPLMDAPASSTVFRVSRAARPVASSKAARVKLPAQP